jgi:C_GCAxxG_C_C family probable redox protein
MPTFTRTIVSNRPDPAEQIAQRCVHDFVDAPYNCAEAVVAAFSEARGEDPRALTPMVTGFGGGVGSLGHMCGAISGGLVVLGRRAGELGLKKPQVRAMARGLYEGFEKSFGTTSCHALTAHDCEAAAGAPYDIRNCAKYLRHVAHAASAMMAEAESAAHPSVPAG